MARIDLWFDYISPYAYFAVFRMKEIAEAYGEQVRLRPVLFAALLDHHGQLGPAEIPAKREHTFKDAARYAALHQLPLQGPAAHPFNPVTALRCSLPEVAGADQAGVVEALFLGSWGHGGDLGDPESVARILTEAGYEGAAMVARTRDPAVKARLREESEAAIARGVFGVPTVDCDGELFWGSDRLDWVALRIEGRDPLPEGAAERLLKVPSGATRPGSKRDAPNPGRSGSGDPKASYGSSMSVGLPEEIPRDTPTIGGGRYYVVNRLGEGGMAGVYRAWDARLRVWRAVKVLFPQYARRERVRLRFAAEARAMARLEHDNLVRMYDVEESGELPFLVMELVMGGTLYDWVLRYGRMAPRMACRAVRQVAAGVGMAHTAGIVHRDVKPQNVLIAPSGLCKLTDFGIALQTGHDLTREGASVGTRGYMAPEQHGNASSVDARADIYSLGATLWTLLTAQVPTDLFNAAGRPELLEGVPKPLRSVIRVCCAPSPDDRLKRAESLDRALSGAMAQLPEDPESASPLTAELAVHEPVGEYPDFPEIRAILEWSAQARSAARHPPHGSAHGSAHGEAPAMLAPTPAPSAPRQVSQASLTDDQPTPQALPYVMPNVQGKATPLRERYRDDGQVPDYIDRDAMAQTPPAVPRAFATEAEVAAQQEEVVVVPPPDAVAHLERPSSTPAPRPMRTVTPSSAKREPMPPLDHAGPAGGSPVRARRPPSTALLAIGSVLAGAVLVLGLLAMVVVAGRATLSSREASLAAARNEVHLSLQDAVTIISALPIEGRAPVEATWIHYTETKAEPARIEAALDLLDRIDQAAPSALMPTEPGASGALATKARRLRAVRARYEEQLAAWRSAAVGFPSSLVLDLGLASGPPESLGSR